MATKLDLTGQIELLHQCLVSDKRPIGLFLGAGCPVAVQILGQRSKKSEPLIPDVEKLTKKVVKKLERRQELRETYEKLITRLPRSEQENENTPNVEDLLSYIRALASVVDNNLANDLNETQLRELEHFICDAIHSLVDKQLPKIDTSYHKLARWISASKRDFPIEIFTPNYDILLEQAMEDVRAPYYDGFPGVHRPVFDTGSVDDDRLPAHWSRIWKLHGSINWYQDPQGDIYRGLPMSGATRRVIYPSSLKYEESRRMPYLALLDRLRNFLKEPTAVLVICGYSFRDDHINEVLSQGLQYTRTSIAFAFLYEELSKHPQGVSLANLHANMKLVAPRQGIIGGTTVDWCAPSQGHSKEALGNAIEWVEADKIGEYERQSLKCNLGDFAHLAEYFARLLSHPSALGQD